MDLQISTGIGNRIRTCHSSPGFHIRDYISVHFKDYRQFGTELRQPCFMFFLTWRLGNKITIVPPGHVVYDISKYVRLCLLLFYCLSQWYYTLWIQNLKEINLRNWKTEEEQLNRESQVINKNTPPEVAAEYLQYCQLALKTMTEKNNKIKISLLSSVWHDFWILLFIYMNFTFEQICWTNSRV